MFTGIIQKTSRVVSVKPQKGSMIVEVAKPSGWRVKKGDSISVNGVCSTAFSIGRSLSFFYMPETLEKTYFAMLKKGDAVNLEQSLKVEDRLDGHIVLGHVDSVGKIRSMENKGQSKVLTISLSKKDSRLVAEKGSVSLEGISFTVVKVGKDFFTVHCIPYTWEHTNLYGKQAGDLVNVEFDVLAKYINRIHSN